MKIFLIVGSFISLLLGVVEFIPFPNAPKFIRLYIQELNPPLFTFLFAIVNLLFFLIFRKKYSLFFFGILCFFFLFRFSIISQYNKLFISFNKDKKVKSVLYLGVVEHNNGFRETYSWAPLFDSSYDLIFSAKHKKVNADKEREIILVIDRNWYERKVPLFE